MPRDREAPRAGRALTLAVWACLLAALLLPPLSYVGYPVYSFEYAVACLVALVLAGLLFWLRAVALLHKFLLFAITLLISLLYFFALAEPYGWIAIAVGTGLAATLAALLVFDEPAALRVIAAACLAQVVFAALSQEPEYLIEWDERPVRSDRRPVIHILLDEHPGLAAAPSGPRHAESVRTLRQRYLEAGFSVFPRAYTADDETRTSVGRLFNPHADLPAVGGRNGMFKYAALLEQIGRNRIIDIAQFDLVRFDPWLLRYHLPVSRLRIFNSRSYTSLVRFEPPLSDRLTIAASSGIFWFQFRSKLPLLHWFLEETGPGRAVTNWIHFGRATHTFSARAALIDYRYCCDFRGTYYFLHTLFPHYPYVFDSGCTMRSVRDWEALKPLPHTDTADHYRLRWEMLLQQSLCASHDVMHIVKALDSRPALRDAMIIIHGDHGSRITTTNPPARAELQYDDAARQRDMRGTFLAIRDGQKPGSAIDDEVRIDAVFEALVASDFQSLDLSRVRRYPDSPYSLPAK